MLCYKKANEEWKVGRLDAARQDDKGLELLFNFPFWQGRDLEGVLF
jgi:hypothetical protein